MHEHDFELHLGFKVFGGRAWAWLAWPLVSGPGLHTEHTMLRCLTCGEQGYEVAA